MTDLAHDVGQILSWACVTLLLGTFGWCVLDGVREGLAWRRLERAIGRIEADKIRRAYRDEEARR